jgi:hypothetical protein
MLEQPLVECFPSGFFGDNDVDALGVLVRADLTPAILRNK